MFKMIKFIDDKIADMQQKNFDEFGCFYRYDVVLILAEIWRNRYNGKI